MGGPSGARRLSISHPEHIAIATVRYERHRAGEYVHRPAFDPYLCATSYHTHKMRVTRPRHVSQSSLLSHADV